MRIGHFDRIELSGEKHIRVSDRAEITRYEKIGYVHCRKVDLRSFSEKDALKMIESSITNHEAKGANCFWYRLAGGRRNLYFGFGKAEYRQ